jgi:DNA polymerase
MTDINVAEVLEDLTVYFQFMKESGYDGSDCDSETLSKLKSWGRKRPDANDSLKCLSSDVGSCSKCTHQSDPCYLLPGIKSTPCKAMFITGMSVMGDDGRAQPFTQQAGELFDKMAAAMKLSVDSIYRTSTVKCVSEKKETPKAQSLICFPYLKREIRLIRPEVICTFGNLAADVLLSLGKSVSDIRGGFYEFDSIYVMPTYHPEELLSDPSKKRPVWEDLKKVMSRIGI